MRTCSLQDMSPGRAYHSQTGFTSCGGDGGYSDLRYFCSNFIIPGMTNLSDYLFMYLMKTQGKCVTKTGKRLLTSFWRDVLATWHGNLHTE